MESIHDAFEVLDLRALWLIVRDENVRGLKLFRQLGFVVTETLVAAAVVKGAARDELRMQLEASEWRKRQAD